jgi:hypothetical protein
MTNEIILVPQEEIKGTLPPQVNNPSPKNEADHPEKKSVDQKKEIPVHNWIMPPEQHGYIQANEKDCL